MGLHVDETAYNFHLLCTLLPAHPPPGVIEYYFFVINM